MSAPGAFPTHSRRPRIVQLAADLQPGDAVSDMARTLQALFSSWGHESIIVAAGHASELRSLVVPLQDWRKQQALESTDLLIYHFAGACPPLADAYLETPATRWLIYHNITPAEWFADYDTNTMWATGLARYELQRVRSITDRALSYSSTNLDDLRASGFARVDRMPLPVDVRHFLTPADAGLETRLQEDGSTRFLFVGRVAPNKCHEDLIRSFYVYHRGINRNSHLYLVGSLGLARYVDRLRSLVATLGLGEAVHFVGKVRADELTAYYRTASAFVCMSEHEGFCVPLLEAMHHRIPVLAYAAAAVPETLGTAGILLRSKRFDVIAETMALLASDAATRSTVLQAQEARLAAYSLENTASALQGVFAPQLGDPA